MPNDSSPLRKRLTDDLEALRDRREFRRMDHPAGLDLSSNDYLGLAADPRLRAAVERAVREAGRVGSTGSRLLSGNSEDWEQAEEDFAKFAGAEAALYFGSGYAANVGALSAFVRPGDVVYSDRLNHASLIDGVRLSGARKVIYPHLDLRALEEAVAIDEAGNAAKVIVTESIFSMDGDRAPLGKMMELARRYHAELIVDEAHAVGVLGPGGRGMAAELGIEREILAIVYPCGKALASAGAFVCSSAPVKHYLVNRARTFIFSTAPPPYLAGQIRAALALVREANAERAHLTALGRALRDGLRLEGFDLSTSQSQIVPVVLGSNEAALQFAESLRADGFAVHAIRPPTVPSGQARLRLSLTAALDRDDINRLIRSCVRARERAARRTESVIPHGA